MKKGFIMGINRDVCKRLKTDSYLIKKGGGVFACDEVAL